MSRNYHIHRENRTIDIAPSEIEIDYPNEMMTNQIYDKFNRALLGSDWTNIPIHDDSVVLSSNQVIGPQPSSIWGSDWYVSETFSDDQIVEFTFSIDSVSSNSGYVGAWLRGNGESSIKNDVQGYILYVGWQFPLSTRIAYIGKAAGGSISALSSVTLGSTGPWSDSVFRAEVNGSILSIYVDNVLIASKQDTTYSTNPYVGLVVGDTDSSGGSKIDDFLAGDLI